MAYTIARFHQGLIAKPQWQASQIPTTEYARPCGDSRAAPFTGLSNYSMQYFQGFQALVIAQG